MRVCGATMGYFISLISLMRWPPETVAGCHEWDMAAYAVNIHVQRAASELRPNDCLHAMDSCIGAVQLSLHVTRKKIAQRRHLGQQMCSVSLRSSTRSDEGMHVSTACEQCSWVCTDMAGYNEQRPC